ncbi:MAG TPA: hypothetical protein VLV54_09095 [Thermoanaerobaculia bacterium]|nr:hypothetical protein [Thermoanaerobaculia bacterium]
MASIINAQGKIFRIWEALLNACIAQAALLPGIDSLKNALQDILNQARLLKNQQETTSAQRQGQTQELADLIKRGDEAARRLRGYAKAQLGTKNELLVQFGTAPIRPRVRSAKKSEPVTATPPKAAA